jgi:hypothetical protein
VFVRSHAFLGRRLRSVSASLPGLATSLALAACQSGGSSPQEAGAPAVDAADAWNGNAPDTTDVMAEIDLPDTALLPDVQGLADIADDTAVASPDLQSPTDPTQPTCTGICNAATPSYPTVEPNGGLGNITMYSTAASNYGACGYGATGVMYFAAVNVNVLPGDGRGQWQGGRICGQCAEVTAFTSQGPRSVVVRIMDKCPDGYCGMDLGGLAPAAIMLDGFGRYDGAWRLVTCTGHPEVSDGPASLVVLPNANPYWSRAHIRNGPGATDEIAWSDSQGGAGSFPYASDPENTFEVPAQVLQSTATSLAITARFADGSAATVSLSPAEIATGNTSYPLR